MYISEIKVSVHFDTFVLGHIWWNVDYRTVSLVRHVGGCHTGCTRKELRFSRNTAEWDEHQVNIYYSTLYNKVFTKEKTSDDEEKNFTIWVWLVGRVSLRSICHRPIRRSSLDWAFSMRVRLGQHRFDDRKNCSLIHRERCLPCPALPYGKNRKWRSTMSLDSVDYWCDECEVDTCVASFEAAAVRA